MERDEGLRDRQPCTGYPQWYGWPCGLSGGVSCLFWLSFCILQQQDVYTAWNHQAGGGQNGVVGGELWRNLFWLLLWLWRQVEVLRLFKYIIKWPGHESDHPLSMLFIKEMLLIMQLFFHHIYMTLCWKKRKFSRFMESQREYTL